jgi:hypothetical protein
MIERLHVAQLSSSKGTVHTRFTEFSPPHDLGHRRPSLSQTLYLLNDFWHELRLPPKSDSALMDLSNAVHLPLAANVILKLSDERQDAHSAHFTCNVSATSPRKIPINVCRPTGPVANVWFGTLAEVIEGAPFVSAVITTVMLAMPKHLPLLCGTIIPHKWTGHKQHGQANSLRSACDN